jgi:hypothetical protein
LANATKDENSIAIYEGADGNLVIDYGTTAGQDEIIVLGQSKIATAIEKIQLSDGTYISNTDINNIIQSMTSYATTKGIQITSISDVKNNTDLMSIVASAWHKDT